MTEKAYAGDVIEVTKEVIGRAKVGEIYIVDMRKSDMGACDDDVLMTDTEIVLYDDEYKIIEKVNSIHDKIKLEEFLNHSNEVLLSGFKWGDAGENSFNTFMRLVRKFNSQ